MNIDNNASDRLAVSDDPKRLRKFSVEALFYRFPVNDAFLLRTEFLYRSLVEGRLILPNEISSSVLSNGRKTTEHTEMVTGHPIP